MKWELKVQGERWFPSDVPFADEMKENWGDWYCDSEVGKLRAVLMHRPGAEIEGITEENFEQYRFRGPINPEKAREEQDVLANIYRQHGVEVHYVGEQRKDKPNAMFMRDLLFMTPEGAIVCRPSIPARRGEERAVARKLGELGVPIIKTINGDGYFEGASAMWVNRKRSYSVLVLGRMNPERAKWRMNFAIWGSRTSSARKSHTALSISTAI